MIWGFTAILLIISARWNWWRRKQEGIPVLMYHKIGNPPKNSKQKSQWVSAKMFEKQMSYILKRGYTPVCFSEIKTASKNKKPVLITFDDGYENNYLNAFPILKDKKIKFNIFAVPEYAGRHNGWHNPDSEPWASLMNWAQIKEMTDSGLAELGGHCLGHRNLTQMDLPRAEREIKEGKKRLEENTGKKVAAFAYPYGAGAFVPEIRKLVFDAGYEYDFSVKQGLMPFNWQRDDGTIRRIFVRGDDDFFDFKLKLTRGRARF